MKKSKRGTPEKLVCDFCGAEKKEITFIIGACSKPGSDWCMIYGTGKMACPACYGKATEEAQNKGRAIEARQATTPAVLDCKTCPKRDNLRACAVCGEKVEGRQAAAKPATAPALNLSALPSMKDEAGNVKAEYLPGGAAYQVKEPAPKAPAMTSKICCVCGATTKGAQHWNRDTGYGVCPVCVVSMKCKGTSDAEIKDLYGVEGVNYPSLAEADAEMAKPAPVTEYIAPGSFESKDAATALRPILDRVIKSVYLPEYRAKVTDAEALGVLIAKFFKWDGEKILAASFSALEDANFHADAAIVDRMKNGEDIRALINDLTRELSAIHSEYCKDCPGGCPTLELIKRAKAD